MATLATLMVQIRANDSDLRRKMENTQRQALKTGSTFQSLNAQVGQLTSGWIGGAAALGGLALGMRNAFRASDEFEASQRRLAATAKITETSLGFLQTIAAQAKAEFRLSARVANDLTVEIGKLAGKAGDLGVSSEALRAFLELGAARGLDAEQTLQAVRQAILGIDEGTDKLFNANPIVLYERYADAIGVSVGSLNDQQKAQAIVNAALEDGNKVLGSYNDFLESAAGKSATAAMRAEELGIKFGNAMKPIRMLGLEIKSFLATFASEYLGGLEILATEISGFLISIPVRFRRMLALELIDLAKWVQSARELFQKLGIDVGEGLVNRLVGSGLEMLHAANRELEHIAAGVEAVKQDVMEAYGVATGAAANAPLPPPSRTSPTAPDAAPTQESIDRTKEAVEWTQEWTDAISDSQQQAERWGSVMGHQFANVVTGTQTVADAFKAMVDIIIRELLRAAAVRVATAILGFVTGGVSSGFGLLSSVGGGGGGGGGGGFSVEPEAMLTPQRSTAPPVEQQTVITFDTRRLSANPNQIARSSDFQRMLIEGVREAQANGARIAVLT